MSTDGKYNAPLSAYNVTESSMRRIRNALATGIGGTTPTRVLCVGDSITQGVSSTPQSSFNWPKRLRDALTASARFGTVGEGVIIASGQTLANYDTRWTAGSGWTRVTGGIYSTMWQAAPGSGNLSLALPSCDTVKVWYTRHSINGTWTYDVDGGTAQSVNASGATGILSSTYSIGSTGTHTLNIHPNATTGYTMVHAVEFWTAASRNKLEVITGGGWNGITTAGLINNNATGFGYVEVIDALKPDIVCILLGRNDAAPGNGVTVAQYQTNLNTMVQRSLVTNSNGVLLIAPPPALLSTYLNDAAIRAALRTVADNNDVPYLDLAMRFGSGWNAGAYPMSTDNIHPNDAGNSGLANAVAAVLLA